jgi:hypothetical protein
MERKAVSIKELRKKFIGREVLHESLAARGYYYSIQDRYLIKPDFKMPDLEMFRPAPVVEKPKDTKPMTEEEIWEWERQLEIESESCYEIPDPDPLCGSGAVNYMLWELADGERTFWLKCLPAFPADVDGGEAYIVLRLEVTTSNVRPQLSDIKVYVRDRRNVDFCNIWGSSYVSRVYEMESMVPPEVVEELEMLVKGRGLFDGFTLAGKPMPRDKSMFQCDPKYYVILDSAFRNVSMQLTINVDEHDIIQSVDYGTYSREPYIKLPVCDDCCHPLEEDIVKENDDPMEGFDTLLFIADCYLDKEWHTYFSFNTNYREFS